MIVNQYKNKKPNHFPYDFYALHLCSVFLIELHGNNTRFAPSEN